jgi:hypothetical protein
MSSQVFDILNARQAATLQLRLLQRHSKDHAHALEFDFSQQLAAFACTVCSFAHNVGCGFDADLPVLGMIYTYINR